MRIVFYNTKSNVYESAYSHYSYFPKRADVWDALALQYPQHEFILVSKLPGMYLLDVENGEVVHSPQNVRYVLVGENDSAEEMADLIWELAPAMAIAISTPSVPLDWSTLKDAIIAEKLEKKGIQTFAHTTFSAIAFFDKWRSHLALRETKFGVAKAIYIHSSLFWAEQTNARIETNVYKEYVLFRIAEMDFPVIIKDTVGAASLGIQVAHSFEHAQEILRGEASKSDVIVEELILGEQFGTEIHGAMRNYHVLPPFRFTMNEEGVTDPVKSVKFGPITDEKYHIPQLQESLRRLAEQFHFSGCAQVDLVFRDGKWYVIEVNPRWSGMTEMTAAAEGRTGFSVFAEAALGSSCDYTQWENLNYVVSFKTPALSAAEMERLCAFPNVKYSMQMAHTKPGREMQYCEVVYGGFKTKEELIEGLQALKAAFPTAIDDAVLQNTRQLAGM